MGRTILLERRQSESVGRRNSRTTFLRSDWPKPFARREVGVEMNWVDPKINDPRGFLFRTPPEVFFFVCDRSFHFAMARTKQTDPEKTVEVMDESIESETTTEVTPEQVCNNLKMLYDLVRIKDADLTCIRTKLAIQERTPIFSEEYVANMIKSKEMAETEKQAALGEISLIHCPIITCKIHNPENNSKINDNLKKDLESVVNKVKSKQLKRAGDEEFKLPKRPRERLRKSRSKR
ncbi:hypothetical protein TNCV_4657631 [Trichonephila clavipes]|nr:hypothetical protein TNCV_4657631 [Trichonephila clavipes]